jgi:hypothetical protein
MIFDSPFMQTFRVKPHIKRLFARRRQNFAYLQLHDPVPLKMAHAKAPRRKENLASLAFLRELFIRRGFSWLGLVTRPIRVPPGDNFLFQRV